jgi:glycine/D-amino acid oxidase-like deaminating enzyme/nitrite reductase/ring-hydroxylating ferredoxin subunit
LVREGKRVVVLDDGAIGSGETGRTTAHITAALDDHYTTIEEMLGPEAAQLAAGSHQAAIQRIASVVRKEKIDCDFEWVDGFLFAGPRGDARYLERERDAALRAGLTNVELLPRAPIESFDTGPALLFPRQGQFHSLRYLAGLAHVVERDGGIICCDTHVVEIADGEPCHVRTGSGYTVTADCIVVATNTPVNDLVTMHTKQAAYRTYVIGVDVPRGSVERVLLWDMEDPYHYVRLDSDAALPNNVLIVGGEDHKTGQADNASDRFARLEEWTRQRFPIATGVSYRWSGQVMEPVDHLAYIGRNPGAEKHVYIITGDSGNGITHGTIAGTLIADLVLGHENPLAALYDPARISARATLDFVKENLNVAAQFTDLITPGDVADASRIRPGEGAIVRRGAHKLAVYRARDGELHERSAVCPHLHCILNWNAVEQSWDCPCHGSRFDAYGRVINGPAITDLAKVESDV